MHEVDSDSGCRKRTGQGCLFCIVVPLTFQFPCGEIAEVYLEVYTRKLGGMKGFRRASQWLISCAMTSGLRYMESNFIGIVLYKVTLTRCYGCRMNQSHNSSNHLLSECHGCINQSFQRIQTGTIQWIFPSACYMLDDTSEVEEVPLRFSKVWCLNPDSHDQKNRCMWKCWDIIFRITQNPSQNNDLWFKHFTRGKLNCLESAALNHVQ